MAAEVPTRNNVTTQRSRYAPRHAAQEPVDLIRQFDAADAGEGFVQQAAEVPEQGAVPEMAQSKGAGKMRHQEVAATAPFVQVESPESPAMAQFDPDFTAKLAVNAWLMSVDPPRQVPRPEGFFDQIVDSLWDADVRAASDIASLEARDPLLASAAARGFFLRVAHPAARAQYPLAGQVIGATEELSLQAGAFDSNRTVELLQQMQAQQFKMFSQLGQKPVVPAVSVDLQKALEELGLQGLPLDMKPNGEAVDKLAARAEKLTKKLKKCNYVSQSVAPFLPPHARDGAVEAESGDEDESETLKTLAKLHGVKKSKPKLSFLQTLEALLRYTVAGAATKQFSLADGLAHLGVVLRVAGQAKRHSAAVAYDQRVREKWANQAFQAGSEGTFDLAAAMGKLDDVVYKEVLEADGGQGYSSQVAYQAPAPKSSAPKQGSAKGAGKNKFTGTCNHCGKTGHRKAECFTFLAEQSKGANRFEQGVEPDNKRRKRN